MRSVTIRFTETEYEELREAAAREFPYKTTEGGSVSLYVKHRIMNAMMHDEMVAEQESDIYDEDTQNQFCVDG